MATEAQLNLFNQLMATGDYAGAAQVAQQANYDPSRWLRLTLTRTLLA
jgi:hypothetical protein